MLASLIGRAIEERRENSILRIFFVEVNKPFAQIYLCLVIIGFKLKKKISLDGNSQNSFTCPLLVQKETCLVRTQKQIIFSFQRDSFGESYKSVRLLLHQKVSC